MLHIKNVSFETKVLLNIALCIGSCKYLSNVLRTYLKINYQKNNYRQYYYVQYFMKF